MARLTRKELKQDPFLSVYYDDLVEFGRAHYAKILLVLLAIGVVIFGGVEWRGYHERQNVEANAMLGAALDTFNAYVGQAAPGVLTPGAQTFPDSQAKYEAALKQFNSIEAKYPHFVSGEIALYHAGICQARLGHENAAIKTLQRAAHASDKDVASLARYALAGEFAGTGKLPQALAMFRDLAEHPTDAVPAPMSWLALATAERDTQPAEARRIYQRILKDYSSDAEVAGAVRRQMNSLSR